MPGLTCCRTHFCGRSLLCRPLSLKSLNAHKHLAIVRYTQPHAQQRAMATTVVDNSFWSKAGQPDDNLIVLILNYHLPDQIEKLLMQGFDCMMLLKVPQELVIHRN